MRSRVFLVENIVYLYTAYCSYADLSKAVRFECILSIEINKILENMNEIHNIKEYKDPEIQTQKMYFKEGITPPLCLTFKRTK